MVERTGPKCRTIWVKVMPEITTEPMPWKPAWNSSSCQGASAKRLTTTPVAANSA